MSTFRWCCFTACSEKVKSQILSASQISWWPGLRKGAPDAVGICKVGAETMWRTSLSKKKSMNIFLECVPSTLTQEKPGFPECLLSVKYHARALCTTPTPTY